MVSSCAASADVWDVCQRWLLAQQGLVIVCAYTQAYFMQQSGSSASRLNMSDTVIIPGALHKLNN